MDNSRRLAILAAALAASALALAEDPMKSSAATNSPAVETLKSSIGNVGGFEVETVRQGDDGVTCIVYRVDNDRGGETKAHAVVDGEKVLRSTSRSKEFENAWNEKCAGSGRQASNK